MLILSCVDTIVCSGLAVLDLLKHSTPRNIMIHNNHGFHITASSPVSVRLAACCYMVVPGLLSLFPYD